MGYRKVGTLEQVWYVIKFVVGSKLEWWKAVVWVEKFHPAWVEIYKRTQNPEVREIYQNMILKGYRQVHGGDSHEQG